MTSILARFASWLAKTRPSARPAEVAGLASQGTAPLPVHSSSSAKVAVVLAHRYRIERMLGQGASGAVYQALDLKTNQAVAVKVMADADSSSKASDLAPSREWLAARRLQHANIAALLDQGRSNGQTWLVMELVPGVPLVRYTIANKLLPTALVLRIGAGIASALAHAHAQGVVHRDVKPANVMVDLPQMVVKLLDFGVARSDDGLQTKTGLTLGTPAYMAPEQLAGAPVSPASDTYALGVMMFELFTGQRPHGGASLGELLRQVAEAPARSLAGLRPDLPAEVAATVQRLLSRDPAKRPPDLAALASHLETLAKDKGRT